jgi:hypothetical protein
VSSLINKNRPKSVTHLVCFGQSDRLLPALVLLVDVGGDTTELQEHVLLYRLSEAELIEALVLIDRLAERSKVLPRYVKVVERLREEKIRKKKRRRKKEEKKKKKKKRRKKKSGPIGVCGGGREKKCQGRHNRERQ